ncbi:Concanavalin A-like lectin/glucanases superfamily protein [Streptomyces sp. yr375]|uniref:LamG domain-containing protein n=1 Tax=Streptomyces sp. yr375 TaxID=1761906 RepID=UPI0008D39EC2|nr:LamG domain-containing protein [Streptomyces sp. yr375]SER77545.1 Concanavalin A-like lectin/glucanases superfamily protein [Streptomyces sp. yr375]
MFALKRRRSLARGAVVTVTAGAVLTAGLVGVPASGPMTTKEAVAATSSEASGDGKALSEEAAQTEATASGKQVEAVNLRTERSETLANPDGTFTLREYVQPVRVFKNGTWAALDTTLVQQPGGAWAPKASTADMAISNGGEGPFATLDRAGRRMSLSWPGPDVLPEPTIEGSTATFADVLPGVDLTVTADVDGFSHLLVVKTAEAAADPRLAEINLPVTTRGVTLQTQAGGGLVAVDDGSDGPVFEAAQPQMWDSAGISSTSGTSGTQRSLSSGGAKAAPARGRGEDLTEGPGEGSRIAPVKLGLRGGAMVLTPDRKLLKSATFPLYIDPVTKTYTRSGWTMVSSHFSTAEFWKFSGHEGVGRCPADTSALCASSDDRKRQFYAIPTGTLAGKDIIDADFAITLANAYNDTARPVVLSRVNSTGGAAIGSATNWDNQPSPKQTVASASTTARAGACTATNQNLRFNVTSAVQQAADSDWATTTFRLAASDESSYAYWNRFCGNGQLEVKYNRLPPQPSKAEMSISPGGKCVTGAGRPFLDTVPTMTAVVRDYDHNDVAGLAETLSAQFVLSKQDATTGTWTQVSEPFRTAPKTSYSDPADSQTGMARFSAKAGLTGTYSAPQTFTLQENVVYAWQVRGGDGQGWGPWSSTSPQACEFVIDKTTPAAPTVTSPEYPDDDIAHTGVGDYGTFTFTTTSTDVVSYRYEFEDGTSGSVSAQSGTGRPGTLRWAPSRSGPRSLTVTAVDAAGKSAQNPGGYLFIVAGGRAPKAAWRLDDQATATAAAGRTGDPSAAKGAGVTFGATNLGDRKEKVAASFDGSQGAHLSTPNPVVDSAKSFSVATWAYLPALPTRDMTLVSQDGTAEPGFVLGYDGVSQKWEFRFPASGIDSPGEWRVLDDTKAVAGLWVHLVAVYDADLHTLRLYKGGKAAAAPVQRRTSWNATGGLQMGRSLTLSGYTGQLKGSLSSVQVYDRLLSESELAEVSDSPPEQLAYWPLDDATNGVSPESGGTEGLALSGGASVYRVTDNVCDELDPTCTTVPAQPMKGDGHLQLDGTSGFAQRGPGLFAAQGSFAVAARARLASPAPGKDQTVFSLAGTQGQAAVVRYSKAAERWQLAVTDRDATDATTVTASLPKAAPLPSVAGAGDHLLVAYDAVFGEVRLYVNGELTGAQTLWPNTWDLSTVSVQVGRSMTGATGSDYFSGALDEVSAYQGVVDQGQAARAAEADTTS